MSILDFFRSKKDDNTASIARERLQIIVAHERGQRAQPDYIAKMQDEILEVIKKYINIDLEQVTVQMDDNDDCSVLELNIVLPDEETAAVAQG